MQKILFHHNCLEQGGAERVVSNLANQMCKDGYEVIVATQWQGEDEFVLEDRVKRIHVGLTKEEENKGRIKKVLIRIKNLRRLLKEQKPDIAIGFTKKPLYRLLLAATGTKIPVIVAVRTDPTTNYCSLTDKICIPLLMSRADGLVFQTDGQKVFFSRKIQKKSVIILNPVSDKYLKPVGDIAKEKRIVHSGRLVDFKNQPMLLRAFLKVHEKHPEYSLLLYGPDSYDGTKQILEELIEKNQAGEYIKLMGGCDQLEKELPKGEIYAFSSDWEGLPNALLEAMCLGMPVVATDCPCGGPRTVIDDGVNGLLVPIADEESFANALCDLIENPDKARRLGEEAIKIATRLDGATITNEWIEYIKKIAR